MRISCLIKNRYLKNFALSGGCCRLPVLSSQLAFCTAGGGLVGSPSWKPKHVQNALHTRRFTCVSSCVISQPWVPAARSLEPLIWFLSAPALPDSGPNFFSVSTDGSPSSRAVFCCSSLAALTIVPFLSLSLPLLSSSAQFVAASGGRLGREEGIFSFVSNLLPEAAPGLDGTGISGGPSGLSVIPQRPDYCTLFTHLSFRYLWVIYHVLGAVLITKSAARWTWNPSTSSHSCGHSSNQATVTSHWELCPSTHFSFFQPE